MLSVIGYKGSGRYEQWGAPTRHPIPGINVPLVYLPDEHTIALDVRLEERCCLHAACILNENLLCYTVCIAYLTLGPVKLPVQLASPLPH